MANYSSNHITVVLVLPLSLNCRDDKAIFAL